MAFFDTITNFFGAFWDIATEFVILILVIVYAILFFAVQFYLIKAYIWIVKTIISKIPFVNQFIKQKFFTNQEIQQNTN